MKDVIQSAPKVPHAISDLDALSPPAPLGKETASVEPHSTVTNEASELAKATMTCGFRGHTEQFSRDGITQYVDSHVQEILLFEALKVRGSGWDESCLVRIDDLKGALARVIGSNPINGDAETVCESFAIPKSEVSLFCSRVMLASKKPIMEFLENSPAIAESIGTRNLQSAKEVAFSESNYAELARSKRLTRAAVSCQVARVASLSPVVSAAIKLRADSIHRMIPPIPPTLVAALSSEIVHKPKECFEVGLSSSPYPIPQPGESLQHLYKRIFLAAFAGSYGDKEPKLPVPEFLKQLPGGLTQFMRALVYRAAGQALVTSSNVYAQGLTFADVPKRLEQNGDYSAPRIERAKAFAIQLISFPNANPQSLWQKVAPDQTLVEGKRLRHIVTPIVAMHVEQRAYEACGIFLEPWTTTWITHAHHIPFLLARYRNQGNMEQVCAATGIDRNQYSVVSDACVKAIPELRKFTPPRWR